MFDSIHFNACLPKEHLGKALGLVLKVVKIGLELGGTHKLTTRAKIKPRSPSDNKQ